MRDGPAMVPGGHGDDTTFPHRIARGSDEVRRATELECAGFLRRLELQRDARAARRGQRRGGDERLCVGPTARCGHAPRRHHARDGFASRHSDSTPGASGKSKMHRRRAGALPIAGRKVTCRRALPSATTLPTPGRPGRLRFPQSTRVSDVVASVKGTSLRSVRYARGLEGSGVISAVSPRSGAQPRRTPRENPREPPRTPRDCDAGALILAHPRSQARRGREPILP